MINFSIFKVLEDTSKTLFMKKIFFCYILVFLTVSNPLFSQNTKAPQEKHIVRQYNTIQAKASFNKEDIPVNEYLTDKLKPIRDNFKRINSIEKWHSIKQRDLFQSTEGGEAKYYYQKNKLEKIITRIFGESGQTLTEYYLLNGQLSFVYEKDYKYNRPLYYDTKAMKENNDTEAFDFDKSEITENRSYFVNGKLIHILSSEDCGAPFSSDYIAEEQKSILSEYSKLLKLIRNK
ncbi:hypothetical protein A4C53_RS19635 [Elizabethkingia anophelis]|nr:hypothetical protein [Elizabethkingia anophelis]EJC8061437.1 hypothetical protein [Elizabethkingia anophelis]EJG2050898.1 hypothetical protein [Elizabethkingia anophelis]EJG2053548.1 hypothetical protein [Elizabethkingia anophelis]EJG2060437.1 hypothetical protein [Elizabethkingia anophelis]